MNLINKVTFGSSLLLQSIVHKVKPGKRIHLIGDSLMAENPWYKYPRTGWGAELASYLNTDKVKVNNYARNGASTKSFRAEGHWQKALDSIKPKDITIMGFSHNDEIHLKPETGVALDDFSLNLKKFIDELKSKGAIPVLCTPIARRSFDNGTFKDLHQGYPDAIRNIAGSSSVTLIDFHGYSSQLLQTLGEEKSQKLYLTLQPQAFNMYPEGIIDNTHLTVHGARVYAKFASDTINSLLAILVSQKWLL